MDYALFVLGRPAAVQARGDIGPSGGIDRVISWFDYGPDGPLVQMEATWMAGAGMPFVMDFRMYFENASLVYSSDSDKPMQLYSDAAHDVAVPPVSAYEAEMNHFIKCVGVGMDSSIVPPESSRLAVAVALAEARSIRTGRPIEID